MKLISFQLSGQYGHFLRAEGGASAPSYPVPPRTVILGLIGAVLGLEKDRPQQVLEPAHIAISGKLPKTHWHKAKLRKDPPASLPLTVKKNQKKSAKPAPEKATLIAQEWLFRPDYRAWVSIPAPYFPDLEKRLAERTWHFQPCLGLSEMMADLNYLESGEASSLPEGFYKVNSIFPQEDGELDLEKIFDQDLVVHSLRMPQKVTPDRVFSHAPYFMERDASPLPVKTGKAFESNDNILIFL